MASKQQEFSFQQHLSPKSLALPIVLPQYLKGFRAKPWYHIPNFRPRSSAVRSVFVGVSPR